MMPPMLQGPANTTVTSGGVSGMFPLNMPASQTPHALSRMVRYLEFYNFYNGEQWDRLPQPGERRLTFNYCRVMVNKSAAYLLGSPVRYQAMPIGATGPRKANRAQDVERYLIEVADWNNLEAVDLATAISSSTLGDGAWTVRWDAAAGMPRVTQVLPSGLDARWRQDDLQTLLWVRQTYYLAPAELTPEQLSRLGQYQGNDPYQPMVAHEEWTRDAWRLTLQGQEIDGGPNVYGQIPYIIFPNLRVPGEFWGESDLVDVLRLQRELNARLSIFSRILEVCGNPVTVITGATEDETAGLRLGPNQMWNLPEGASAFVLELLNAGGADAHFKYIDLIYKALHDISEMPRMAWGGQDAAATQARSGIALEILLQALLQKMARKRAILTPALARRAQLILVVARVHGKKLADVRIGVDWPPTLPRDVNALAQREVSLVEAGIHSPIMALDALEDPDPEAAFEQVIASIKRLADVGASFVGGPAKGGLPTSTSPQEVTSAQVAG